MKILAAVVPVQLLDPSDEPALPRPRGTQVGDYVTHTS